jgi:SulP family sulfate permease
VSSPLSDLDLTRLRPRLLDVFASGYTSTLLTADVIAGMTVGLVALPLAMAFGIASGTTPEAGLYTAIVGGLLVSLLGGSSVQIGGPTGAFVVIVAGIIAQHGLSGLLMVTMMAGVFLVLLAVTGLGTAVKFIPRPILIGFTNGIAILIASTQIRDALGLQMASVPGEFVARMEAYWDALATTQTPAVVLTLVSLAVILLVPRLVPRVPGAIAALLLGTAASMLMPGMVETVGSRFGGIPGGLPTIAIPALRADLILPLLPAALTVGLLSAVESLLSATVADRMTGEIHNPHAELLAQGVANIAVPLVGGIPVTGAIARTATNVRAGARSPVSGVVHACTLLAVVLVMAPLAQHIPMATLAAVLFVVAWNMGEWFEIPGVVRLGMTDRIVWLVTFLLTVLADLTVAVEVGMVLAALLYVYQVSETSSVSIVTPEYIEEGQQHSLQLHDVPPYVSILRIHGPFLFGTTDKLAQVTHDLSPLNKIVIVRLRNMNAIDATGLHALETFADRLHQSERHLLLCGARDQPARMLRQANFVAHIGQDNITASVQQALTRARDIHHQHREHAS